MSFEGILLMDKPKDFTSFDVIAKVRGMSRQRRIGHSGTLDPMATGVLPLFLGRAAKIVSLLPRDDKGYTGIFQLGLTTDTQDLTGRVLCQREVQASPEQVMEVCQSFQGDILQTPPMYSALKVDGQKLCDLARKGKTVERPARPAKIYSIACAPVDVQQHLYRLEVHCGGGTYIRTLVNDIGEKLGCGGALASLQRTMAAGYDLSQCIKLEDLQHRKDADRFGECVLPIETAFTALPEVVVPPKEAYLLTNGVRLEPDRVPFAGKCGMVRAKDSAGRFLGVLEYTEDCIRSRFVMLDNPLYHEGMSETTP